MLLAILIPVDVMMILCLTFIPYVTRKTELFGVTVPADKTNIPELRVLRASYRNLMLIAGLILIAASIWLTTSIESDSPQSMTVFLALIFAYLIAGFLIYLPKHFKMLSLKKEFGWDTASAPAVVVADTKPAAADVISPAWLLLFPLIITLTLAVLMLLWPQIPQIAPTHFDVDGTADSFTPKGWRLVATVFAPQVFLALIISLVYVIVRNARRQTDAANPKASRLQDARYRHFISMYLVAVGALSMIFMSTISLYTMVAVENVMTFLIVSMIIFLILLLAGTLYLMFAVGQGGSRLSAPKESSTDVVNVDEDRYWILGQFYFNPNDPAVFVEKRFGVGYTSNFARPLTWVIILGFFLLVAALLVFSFSLQAL